MTVSHELAIGDRRRLEEDKSPKKWTVNGPVLINHFPFTHGCSK
jgi:hypothetical protein